MTAYMIPAEANLVTTDQPVSGVLITADGVAVVVKGKGFEVRGLSAAEQRELAGALTALATLREMQVMSPVTGHA